MKGGLQCQSVGWGSWKLHCDVMLRIAITAGLLFNSDSVMAAGAQVQLPAYLGGTVIGMSMWSILYASLGAASRQLLDGGMDMGTLFAGERKPGISIEGAQHVDCLVMIRGA